MNKYLALLILAFSAVACQQNQEQETVNDVNVQGFFDFLSEQNPVGCALCKSQIGMISLMINIPFVSDIAAYIGAEYICPKVVANATICSAVVSSFKDSIVAGITGSFLSPLQNQVQYLFNTHKVYFCEYYVPICTYQTFQRLYAQDYVDNLNKPASLQSNDFLNNLYQSISGQTGRDTIQVVHMTDVHFDNKYAVGSDAFCNLPLCCRAEDGFPTESYRQAGQWGNYLCDFPEGSFRNMLQFLKNTINPSIIFWTGDNAPHNMQDSTIDDVIASNINVTNMIKQELSGLSLSVYPIQGNHDVFPVNVQDFSSPGINAAINGYSPAWADWLDQAALAQFREYGYYSTPLRFPNGTQISNTTIIALNTQACNLLNIYLMKNKNDPGNQIAWLESVLSGIEANNGQAIIIAHYPTTTDCLKLSFLSQFIKNNTLHSWGHRFRGLLDRYQNIIRMTHYGHTHLEDIQVVQSLTDNKNIGFNFFAGSLTPNVGHNPSFNVFTFDQEYMIPLNIQTYYMDLNAANTNGQPTWALLHDYLSYYSLPDMRPDNLRNLANQVLSTESVALTYWWNENRQAGVKPTSCDAGCRQNLYCNIVATEALQNQLCRGSLLSDFVSVTYKTFLELLDDEWIVNK